MSKKLGEVILQKRSAMHKSQRELAREVGVGNSTIARIERGDPVIPDNKTLKAISESLALDYNYLLALNKQIDDDVQMRIIQRAARYLTSEEKERMVQILQLIFPEAFSKAGNDGDTP